MENEAVATPQEGQAPAQSEEVRDPQAVLAKNKELLGEIKSLKSKLGDYETEKEKRQRKELEEQGKYEEVRTELESQLNELKGYKEKWELASEAQEKALRELSKDIDEELADVIITHQSLSFDEKIAKINGLKKQTNYVPTKTEGASTGIRTVTKEELSKMSALERAEYYFKKKTG